MQITNEQLKQIVPAITDLNCRVYTKIMNGLFDKYEIDTNERLACFLAQIAHESQNFTRTRENLNYSAKRLLEVFPKYFTVEKAKEYEHQPVKIANYVYGNREGNGDEASGDGWKYRGGGLMGLTFFNNYNACSYALFNNDKLVRNPELIEELVISIESAFWYWEENKLNQICDDTAPEKFKLLTRRINRACLGLKERKDFYERAKKVLTN